MNDLIKVNILSSGRIPWMNIPGPKYGISISKRLYTLLSNDPRVKIELATESTAKPVSNESLSVSDEIVIKKVETVDEKVVTDEVAESVDEVVDESEEVIAIEPESAVDTLTEGLSEEELLDNEIEANLGDFTESFPDTTAEALKEDVVEGDEIVSVDFKVYTEEELWEKSKEELKQILSVERSCTSGENAPKYADNKTVLIEKIMRTQG